MLSYLDPLGFLLQGILKIIWLSNPLDLSFQQHVLRTKIDIYVFIWLWASSNTSYALQLITTFLFLFNIKVAGSFLIQA